jgi:hypothetical protein
MKDVEATGEAFSPQKRKSSTLEHETSFNFSILWSFMPSWIRIQSWYGYETLLKTRQLFIFFFLDQIHRAIWIRI